MDILFGTLQAVMVSIPFIVVILLALLGVWAVIAASQQPLWGAWALALGFLIETWFIIAPQIPLGIRVSSTDLASLVLLGGLAGRFVFGGLPLNRGVYLTWLGVGAVLLASLGFGLIQFGTKAGVDVRENFYFWVAALYFASYQYTQADLRKLARVLRWTAWGVVAVAAYRWVGLEAGFISRGIFLLAGASSEFRAVGAHPALLLGIVGVMYFARWIESTLAKDALLAMFFLGFVVVLQHRSVWLAVVVMLLVLLWLRRERLPQVLPWLVGGLVVSGGAISIALALGQLDSLSTALGKSITSATSSDSGTHMARINGWTVLLGDWLGYSPRELFFGKAYGSGFARWVDGRLDDFSPHNFYVELLLRIGLIGLLAWLAAILFLVRAAVTRRLALVDGPGANIALAIMLGLLVFYWAYQGNYFQGAGYGLAMALAMAWAWRETPAKAA